MTQPRQLSYLDFEKKDLVEAVTAQRQQQCSGGMAAYLKTTVAALKKEYDFRIYRMIHRVLSTFKLV